MLSKGNKLLPKASRLGVHKYFIYFRYNAVVFCLVFIYFHSLFGFFIHIIFYRYIVIFSILCFERPKVVREMYFSIESNKDHPYKLINALLDLALQSENS